MPRLTGQRIIPILQCFNLQHSVSTQAPISYRTRLTGGMVREGVEPNLFTVLFIRAVFPLIISLVKTTTTMMVQVLHNSKNFTSSFTCMHTPPKESNTSFSSE